MSEYNINDYVKAGLEKGSCGCAGCALYNNDFCQVPYDDAFNCAGVIFKLKVPTQTFMEKAKETGGTNCPCCGQHAQIYKRKFNAEMAFGLIALLQLTLDEELPFDESGDYGTDFFHVSKILAKLGRGTGGGDFAKAVHWGLIKQKENDDPKKRTSGFWSITEKGADFALMLEPIKSHVFLYNGKYEGFSEGETMINDALGEKFDYFELING